MVPPFVVVSPFPPQGVGLRKKGCTAVCCRSSRPSTPNRVTHLGRRTMRRLAVSEEHPMNKPERLTEAVAPKEFLVGGVRMKKPFRIRRLGHVGVNVANPAQSKDFYCQLLGLRVADPID